MEPTVETDPRSFSRQSPYLDGAQRHHDSDFKYARFQSLVSGSAPVSDSVAGTGTANGSTKVVDKQTIGMALFGLGRAGTIHLGNLMVNPRVKLLYVLEKDEARYQSLKERWGDRIPPNVQPEDSDKVMADASVDAVLVATPTHTHFAIIQQALLADKMVFSEKPIGEDAEQARVCYKLAAERGLSVFCAFNRRFDPAFQTIRKAVRRGDVGVVHSIKTVARDSPLPSIDYLKQSGGIFHDCAVHDIDTICWILGQFPLRVFASGSAHVPEIAAMGDHDTVIIVMEFEGGAIATIDLSRNSVYGYDQRLEVFGPAGLLTAGNERPINVSHLTSNGETSVPYYFSFPSRYSEGYGIELDSFLDHVQGKVPLPILPEDSLRVSKIASACEESIRTRAFVELNYESCE